MNFIDIIKTVAPTVASAFGTPLVGMAISAVGSILGISEPTQESIATAFTNGQIKPEDMARLKTLELEFKTHESDMGFKYADLAFKGEELIAKDRIDARGMQVATHSRMPAVLTIFVTVGFFSVLGALILNPTLKADGTALVMVGQLSAVWAACVGFYVSTTFNSTGKTNLLAQSTPKLA